MSEPVATLSSTAFWGRERKGHQARRFADFMAERHPAGLPNLEACGVASFHREFWAWQEAKGFERRDCTSDRQLRRIRKAYETADMSAHSVP